MNAPVCPISRSQPVPGMPGKMLPYVSPPVDLPSAIVAVKKINQIVQSLSNPVLTPAGGHANATNPNQDSGKGLPHSVWAEKSRTTKKVKYYNPEDDQVWIEVERITQIVWVNRVSRTSLTFVYGQGTGGLNGNE